jgi:hypothetical protein
MKLRGNAKRRKKPFAVGTPRIFSDGAGWSNVRAFGVGHLQLINAVSLWELGLFRWLPTLRTSTISS